MFVGHLAVALAAKSRVPRTSLGALVAAAFGLDLLWPIFVLLGWERVRIEPGNTAFTPLALDSYPWSHSLAMAVLWGALAALLARRAGTDRAGQLAIALLVLSHWVLDFGSHRADMPLWPGRSPLVGLGLWRSVAATLVVEGALLAAGLALYVRATRALDRVGVAAFWSLVVVCTILWASQPWSPPPPSARAVAWVTLGAWLFPVWAGWADRHRVPRAAGIAARAGRSTMRASRPPGDR